LAPWLATTLKILIFLTMLVGQLGLVIPIFPGNVVIWAAALVYGILFGFGLLGWISFALLTVLMLIAVTVDNVLMGAKARQEGAAWRSIILALLAGLVFTFVFPPVGGLIAAPLVLFLMEFHRLGDSKKASRVVRGLLTGLGLSFIARFLLGLVMLALWAIWYFLG
jgi:hypothetical protein